MHARQIIYQLDHITSPKKHVIYLFFVVNKGLGIYTRLASNSKFSCHSLPSAGIIDVFYHTSCILLNFVFIYYINSL